MNYRKKWSALLCVLALVVTLFSFDAKPTEVFAKSSSALKEEQQEEQEKLDAMKEQKQELEQELGDMKSDLSETSDKVLQLSTDIDMLEKQIEVTQASLEEAQKKENEQYEQMKLRIQFMYESSSNGQLNYILGAGSISDFLNRTEYISSLTSYDRNLLDSFVATRNEIAAAKKKLEEDKASLLASKEEMEQQKETLLASIENQKSEISQTEDNISDQSDKVDELEKQIKIMIAYENKLKEQQMANKPDVSNLVKISLKEREESMPTWGRIVTPRAGEEELLAAIIYCEAGDEPYEGMVAVGTVVLNRVNSQFFPNTITDVIYSPGQFTPVWSGRLSVVMSKGLTTDACRRAAREVLDGNFTGTWLYFCTVRPSVTGDLIGTQVFY